MTVSEQRTALHQAIDWLPESTFAELARFIEFLQFKRAEDPPANGISQPSESSKKPLFNPVHFPEAIVSEIDFSPEYISQARKELWAGFGGVIE